MSDWKDTVAHELDVTSKSTNIAMAPKHGNTQVRLTRSECELEGPPSRENHTVSASKCQALF